MLLQEIIQEFSLGFGSHVSITSAAGGFFWGGGGAVGPPHAPYFGMDHL